jgi:hypothetical protein
MFMVLFIPSEELKMTKQEITNALIEAGLDRFLAGTLWEGNDCFVSNYDLGRCKTGLVITLTAKADYLVTDKGLVFQARVAA